MINVKGLEDFGFEKCLKNAFCGYNSKNQYSVFEHEPFNNSKKSSKPSERSKRYYLPREIKAQGNVRFILFQFSNLI